MCLVHNNSSHDPFNDFVSGRNAIHETADTCIQVEVFPEIFRSLLKAGAVLKARTAAASARPFRFPPGTVVVVHVR